MAQAFVYFNGSTEPRLMSDREILVYVRTHPGTTYRCECQECRQPVRLNDKPGSIAGVNIDGIEIAKSRKKVRSPFSHFKGNNSKNCSRYKPYDPGYANRDSSGESGKLQKQANMATIADMRKTFSDLDEALYFEMTGRIGIPSNVKQELDHLEPQFMGKTCLADRKFAYWLSFMKFSALSPQPREFADGVRMVVFKPQGEISEKVKRHNGHVEIATMSAAIVLYYADPTDQVVIDKKGIRVPVDTHKAYDLIVAARQRRFEAAKAETVETVSPVLQQIAIKSVSHQEMPLIPSDRVKHSGRAKPTDPNQALLPL